MNSAPFIYYITTYLCGGQHCVFIQAEDSVGHYGLVGQEATAHHLQEEQTGQSVKTTQLKWGHLDFFLETALIQDDLIGPSTLKLLKEQM